MRLTERVQILVEETAEDGTVFTDALYFTPEERAALKDEELQAAGQARYDGWKAIVDAPPKALSEKERIEGVRAMLEQKAQIEAAVAAVAPADMAKALAPDTAEVAVEVAVGKVG